MGGFGENNLQSHSPLKDVYVARTVLQPQPEVERFLNGLAGHLGRTATIYTIGSTHLTFLESRGLQPHFEKGGYEPEDISDFKDDLQQHLEAMFPDEDRGVTLNPKRPLRYVGCNKIALNIYPTPHLKAVRAGIEAFLKSEFGRVPRLQRFEPHVTVGEAHYEISRQDRTNSRIPLPGGLRIPRDITMNGLSVYLGSIHSGTRRAVSPAPRKKSQKPV